MSFHCIIHSDKNRVPRYWVESNDKVIFESENASETIQWAIDNSSLEESQDETKKRSD